MTQVPPSRLQITRSIGASSLSGTDASAEENRKQIICSVEFRGRAASGVAGVGGGGTLQRIILPRPTSLMTVYERERVRETNSTGFQCQLDSVSRALKQLRANRIKVSSVIKIDTRVRRHSRVIFQRSIFCENLRSRCRSGFLRFRSLAGGKSACSDAEVRGLS